MFRIKKVAWNCEYFAVSNRDHLMKIKKRCEGRPECSFIVNHKTFGPDFGRCSDKAESEYRLELTYSCPGDNKDNNRVRRGQYQCEIPTSTTTTTTTMFYSY